MRERLVITALVGALFVVIATIWHVRFLRQSRPAVSVAIARAYQSQEVIRALGGAPIRVSHVTGNLIGVGDYIDSGNADLAIEIVGLRGKGKLLEWAQNGLRGWHVCSLSFVDSMGRETVIMPDEDAKCERE